MRAPQWVSDFIEWRWAPCLGLTAGSLAFVACAVLLIPTRFDGPQQATETLSSLEHSSASVPRALFGASLAQAIPVRHGASDSTGALHLPAALPVGDEPLRIPQRGFSPVLDRPEPAPPPATAPLPVATPAPAPDPGAVNVPQPEPNSPPREGAVP